MQNSPEILTQSLKIDGMTCVNCALSLEKSMKKIGVKQVHVNFPNKELIFENPGNISAKDVENAVKNAGFAIQNNEKQSQLQTQILGGFSLLIALYFMFTMFLHHSPYPYFDAILALISLSIAFYKFGKGAFFSVKSGEANMYVLILLGASTAFFFSLYLLITQSAAHLYFETTAVLVALVLLGDYIEMKAMNSTLKSLQDLSQSKVQTAKVFRKEIWENISLNALRINDVVLLNSGDEVQTDGRITYGEAYISEAHLSGEARPIFKQKLDSILGGSILLEGSLQYQVEKAVHLSSKAKIHQLIQEAQSKKAHVQKLADTLSSYFVPGIVLIALLNLLVSHFAFQLPFETALIRSIAILVVSCPCAMGLATPVAIMVGIEKMSRAGILIKNPNVFEHLAKLQTLYLDKTGSLTHGNFEMQDFQYFDVSKEEAQAWIIGMETHSSHPIAHSILKAWQHIAPFKFQDVKEIKGKGLQATDAQGNTFLFGNALFTQQTNVSGSLFLTKNAVLVAQLSLKDSLRSDAQEMVSYFQKQNIALEILSGDQAENCQDIQKQLNIPVRASLLPADKLKIIEANKAKITALLGDGINDAPSLAQVHVGVSFAEASNLAMQNADVLLMKPELGILVKAHKIAKLCYKTIKQNLFWAFAYNVFAIPLAALGIIHPLWAAGFMIFSDLMVVGNAFLMKRKVV